MVDVEKGAMLIWRWKGKKPEDETDQDDEGYCSLDECNYLHRGRRTHCNQSCNGTSKCSDEVVDLKHKPCLVDSVYSNNQSDDREEVKWFMAVSLQILKYNE